MIGTAILGCGPSFPGDGAPASSDGGDDGPTSTTPTTSTTGGASTTDATTTTSPVTTTDEGTTGTASTADASDENDTCGGFYGGCPVDVGQYECSVWLQDCFEGQKCMPWASDGPGGTWNSTRCSPLSPQPDAVGEPCQVELSAMSGIDSCGLGAICFDVDPTTSEGTCEAMCAGDPATPECNAGTCVVFTDAVFGVCVEPCQPDVADACPPEQSCEPVFEGQDEHRCVPVVPP